MGNHRANSNNGNSWKNRAGSNHDRVIVVVEGGRAGPLLVRLGEVDHSVAQEDVAAQQELSPAIGKEPVSAAVVFGTL